MAKTTTIREEERMWCGHCGVDTPIRHEGKTGSLKACNWCGKVLADETGTADQYTQLFLRLQERQSFVSVSGCSKKSRRIKPKLKVKKKS